MRRPGSDPSRWIALGIALATAATYAPVVQYGFVNFDDPDYVSANWLVQRGLTREGFVWAFGGFHAANWHPLTWLSHMLDCQLFGMNPGAHHATSVVLHALAAALLFAALRRMTGAPWRSAAVAVLFALHPLRVESVAWVAERKDVLCAFFWATTLLAYTHYVERPGWRRYLLVLLGLAAALLAKPMAVSLPLALLLLDVWPLGRWRALGPRILVEKLPLFALAAGAAVVTFFAQRAGGTIVSLATQPLGARLANALLSYAAYLELTAWPHALAIFYPPRETFPAWRLALAAATLVSISAVVAWRARREPWLLVGWVWYVVLLLPVIGIVRAGDQAMADRFTYLPHVGLFVALVWGLAEWTAGWTIRRAVLSSATALVLAACVAGTELQLRHWRDSLSLFGHALAVTERNPVAHTNYGFALLQAGRPEEALEHFREAVALRPEYAKAHLNLGLGLATLGRPEAARAEYEQAIRLDPRNAATHYNLGIDLAQAGRVEDAIAEYEAALRLDPRFAEAHNNLGLALAREGRATEALAHYERALALAPPLTAAHNNVAVVLERLGRPDDAMAHYREAVRLAPDDARGRFNLGAALAARGQLDEAATAYRDALRREPALAEAHLALGDLLSMQRSRAAALAEYRTALAARPDWPAAQARVASVLATAPDGDAAEAVRLAERARDASGGGDPEILKTLASAYAAAGRLADAAHVAERAAEVARSAGLESLAADAERLRAAYIAGRLAP